MQRLEVERYNIALSDDNEISGIIQSDTGSWCKYEEVKSYCDKQEERIKELEEELGSWKNRAKMLDSDWAEERLKRGQLQYEKTELEEELNKTGITIRRILDAFIGKTLSIKVRNLILDRYAEKVVKLLTELSNTGGKG